jgi:hypothetical protein
LRKCRRRNVSGLYWAQQVYGQPNLQLIPQSLGSAM